MQHTCRIFVREVLFQQKRWDRGNGRMHPKGANSMATSGLVSRSNLVGTGRAISVLFGVNGVRNKQSHLVGPFQLRQVGISLET